MEKIIFITSNQGKAKYLSDYFHMPVEHLKIDLPEIQSLNLYEIAADKAKRAYREVKKPVLVGRYLFGI
jgi:inosine/xanthosine triphosphate pyrophosphatase family protein